MIYPRLVGLLTFIMLLAGCTVPNVQTLTQAIPADTSQVDTTPDGDATRMGAAGQRADLLSAVISVTPLAPGPALVLAESVPVEQWKLDQSGGPWSVGSGCPDGTVQAIRAVWQGGITKPNGDEVDDVERTQYTVTLDQSSNPVDMIPFALGDLDDGDNNHLLCLDGEGIPQSISFSAGYVVDPNGDLNPATEVEVQPLPPKFNDN